MNIKSRVLKIEKWHSQKIGAKVGNPAVDAWLKTLTLDELLFLRDCRTSEETRLANAAELKILEARFDEYQKQN